MYFILLTPHVLPIIGEHVLTHSDQSEAEEVTKSQTPYTLLVGLHRRNELLERSLQQTSTLTQILTLSTWMTRFSTSLY